MAYFIGRLAYGGRLEQFDARVALKENTINQFKNQVNEEVNKSRSQLLMASEQLELAEESQHMAKEAVEQSIQRQQLGTAKHFEVFQHRKFISVPGWITCVLLPAIIKPNTAYT